MRAQNTSGIPFAWPSADTKPGTFSCLAPEVRRAAVLDLVGGIEPPISRVAICRLTHLATPGWSGRGARTCTRTYGFGVRRASVDTTPPLTRAGVEPAPLRLETSRPFRWTTGPGDASRNRTCVNRLRRSAATPFTHRAKCRSFPAVRAHWYSGEDLHLHALRHRLLRTACLLFHHPSKLVLPTGFDPASPA